ncbi:Chromobox protein 1 [Paramecium bursaria]
MNQRQKKRKSNNSCETYTVEQILDDRIINNKKSYLVKWEGYEKVHNSWIEEDWMETCEELKEEYETNKFINYAKLVLNQSRRGNLCSDQPASIIDRQNGHCIVAWIQNDHKYIRNTIVRQDQLPLKFLKLVFNKNINMMPTEIVEENIKCVVVQITSKFSIIWTISRGYVKIKTDDFLFKVCPESTVDYFESLLQLVDI